MKKRALNILLSIIVLLGMLPVAAIIAFATDSASDTPLYFFDFDTDPFANGWTCIDFDGDGEDWKTGTQQDGKSHGINNSSCAVSKSFLSGGISLQADNWMISPAITLPASCEMQASWYVKSYSAGFPDSYEVYVTESIPRTESDLSIAKFSEQASVKWTHRTLNLSKYAEKTVHIVFRHKDSNELWLMLDNFAVEPVSDHTFTGAEVCPKCDGTHADNFFGQITCFFNRICNWLRNLFK